MIVWLTTVHRIQDGTGHSKTEKAEKENSVRGVFLCLHAVGLMMVRRLPYFSDLTIRYSFSPGILKRLGHWDSMVIP